MCLTFENWQKLMGAINGFDALRNELKQPTDTGFLLIHESIAGIKLDYLSISDE